MAKYSCLSCSCITKLKISSRLFTRPLKTGPARPTLSIGGNKRRTRPGQVYSEGRFRGSEKNSAKVESVVTSPKEFSINVVGGNPAFDFEPGKRDNLKNDNSYIQTFAEISGLRRDVVNGIETLSISQPTVIQSKTIPLVLQGKNVLCAAQTGSGKTLAYLAPVLNVLKNEEDMGFMTRYHHPVACIIAPFRELSAQILQVVKMLSHQVPIRSVGCIGGEKDGIMFRKLRERPVDIIVGTPGTIIDLLRRRKISFSDLKYMVLDEVDTMYDSSYRDMTNQLLKSTQFKTDKDAQVASSQCKFVFAAATLPKHGVLNGIMENIPNMEVVKAKLHHVLPHVKYHFIKSLQPEKPIETVKILKSRISVDRKGIVFVNTSTMGRWLSKYLSEQGIPHLKLLGKDSPEERQKIFKEFRSSCSGIVISTDLASRGLDFPELSFVINYDCPLNTTDFIHRAGRTGRARAEYVITPEIYTLLSRNWEITFARKIQLAAEGRKAVSGIDVIKRKQNLVPQSRGSSVFSKAA